MGYNPDQARVPAGSSDGGQFASGSGGSGGGIAKDKSKKKTPWDDPATREAHAKITLPKAHDRYFNMAGAKVISLDKIQPIRAREKGVFNAGFYMRAAYDGQGGKRDPISLEDNGDGTYTVMDGNSTYANAVKHGWGDIPAKVWPKGEWKDPKAEHAPEPTPKTASKKVPSSFSHEKGLSKFRDAERHGDKKELARQIKLVQEMIQSGHLKGSLGEHIKVAKAEVDQHKESFARESETLTNIARSIDPSVEVKGRVKLLESALGKIVRKANDAVDAAKKTGKEPVIKYPNVSKLGDLTGFMIITDDANKQQSIVEALRSKYKLTEEESFIHNPQGSNQSSPKYKEEADLGYRAVHLAFVGDDGKTKELQIKSRRQFTYSSWCHDVYKPTNARQRAFTEKYGKHLRAYGRAVSSHYNAKDLGRPSMGMPPCTRIVKLTFGCLDDI